MTTRRPTPFLRALYELLSSMRFAISLLTVLAVAAVVGTVLKQNEPYTNYHFEFGDFWFGIFEPIGLFDVYHAGWFLGILAFLLLSLALCIYRHLPGMLRDIKGYREHASLTSLKLMHHVAEQDGSIDLAAAQAQLGRAGYRWKIREENGATLLAAKRGSWQKLGYFFAHAAIVVICIGGLLDGNVGLKISELLGSKTAETREIPASAVPQRSRLGADNGAFRGNVELNEGGGGADVVFINSGNGYYVQELPFIVRLKQFHIEHYSTGQPKKFASDIEVLDRNTGKLIKAGTVEVNKPLIVNGIAIYQSSFGDGGSDLTFARRDLQGGATSTLQGRSKSSQPLTIGKDAYTLETGDLRVFNIENMGKTGAQTSAVSVNQFEQALQAARSVKGEHNLRNVGPSIQFKLRDSAGQASEYLNYLAPFSDNGALYLVSGMRRAVSEPFAFVQLPLDDDVKPDTFLRLRHTLLDPQQWPAIARRTSEQAFKDGAFSATKRADFEAVTQTILQQFAQGGFPAIERFLAAKVPKAERPAVAQTYLKILQGAAVDALTLAQQQAGQPVPAMDERHYRFVVDSLVATSALFDYGSSIYLQPTGFTEIKSSGLQLTRAPGMKIVFLGSILLVLGIFCMFYIREERLWLHLANGRTLLAMSSNRRTSDFDREFERQRAALLPAANGEAA
ncbi:cytochrome c biogenesis protein [Andreprevotia lacus DSM 23236]|jgi:cytochrome c biogenesis protein|uniref:Cytochrome c biogenesis protein n=1 Tax=Andreprevotia lacus DSM 23236 TaxID=1121001 RepID=A0A1W1XSL6_9NEIS|nr:cytochrome c biogenesis protein ResB [Andreprevotia lacus]SMC26949.1 cytochrome c biogenesis protein [Andreprevotia lacus DSM 23236]